MSSATQANTWPTSYAAPFGDMRLELGEQIARSAAVGRLLALELPGRTRR